MEPDYENEVSNPLDTVRETKEKVEDVKKKVDATKNATQKLGKAVKNIGSTLSHIGTTIVSIALNPITWIIVGSILVIMVSLSVALSVGSNDNKCLDGKNTTAGLSAFEENSGATDDEKINQIGSWLMAQEWGFIDGGKMSKKQSAGIVGNIQKESNLNFAIAQVAPGNEDGRLNRASNSVVDSWTKQGPNGLGAFQWTHNPGRAKTLIDKANAMGANWYDAEVQLELLKEELNGSYGAELANSGFNDPNKDERELASIFHDVFERSADASLTARQDFATGALSKISGEFASTAVSCKTEDSLDLSDVAKTAVAMSHPLGTPESKYLAPGCGGAKSKAMPAYVEGKEKQATMVSGVDTSDNGYADCGKFVATVVNLTMDKDYPVAQTGTQLNYVMLSPKWSKVSVKSLSDLKPGDVAHTPGHTYMYVGEVDGTEHVIAEASLCDFVPRLRNASPISDVNASWYRFKG